MRFGERREWGTGGRGSVRTGEGHGAQVWEGRIKSKTEELEVEQFHSLPCFPTTSHTFSSPQPVKMPTTIHSLAPELILEILCHLPVTVDFGGPRPLPAPCPLLATSLVSKKFRELSQQVLFQEAYLCGKGEARLWAETGARRWTKVLTISLGRSDFTKNRDWLIELFAATLGASEADQVKLEFLELSGVPCGRLGEDWVTLPGIQGQLAV